MSTLLERLCVSNLCLGSCEKVCVSLELSVAGVGFDMKNYLGQCLFHGLLQNELRQTVKPRLIFEKNCFFAEYAKNEGNA